MPTEDRIPLTQHPATFTFDPSRNLYYFKITGATSPPYLTQREVPAILDLDGEGNLVGVELIEDMPPPSTVTRPGGARVKFFNWRQGYRPRHKRRPF